MLILILEFTNWKLEIEKDDKVHFVKDTGVKNRKSGKRYFFYCHRSHKEKHSGKGKRNIKSAGTNKLNSACPASMIVTEKDNGEVDVCFWKSHFGHTIELGRLPLQDIERQQIAGILLLFC